MCTFKFQINKFTADGIWNPETFEILMYFVLLSAFLQNLFLCQDRWHGDVPPHLAQPYSVALGRLLIQGLCFEDWISKGPVFKGLGYGFSYCNGPKHSKTEPLQIWRFLFRFQMVFDKMAVICPHFKWLGFRISDPFEIRTIFRPTSVWPFEIRTRSPLIKSCK